MSVQVNVHVCTLCCNCPTILFGVSYYIELEIDIALITTWVLYNVYTTRGIWTLSHFHMSTRYDYLVKEGEHELPLFFNLRIFQVFIWQQTAHRHIYKYSKLIFSSLFLPHFLHLLINKIKCLPGLLSLYVYT